MRIAQGIVGALAHQAEDGDVQLGVESVDARQERTRHVDQPAAGGGAHQLGFHLFGMEDVDVTLQIGDRRH